MNNGALLEVQGLHAYYGPSHVLQGLDFAVGEKPVSIIGRNGMGKTTMCHAIMGMHPSTLTGSIRFGGLELVGKPSYKISRAGLALVPQGRRLFGSLTVDEHLKIVGGARATGNGGRARSTSCSRAWESARRTTPRSYPVVSSRCWPLAARCS